MKDCFRELLTKAGQARPVQACSLLLSYWTQFSKEDVAELLTDIVRSENPECAWRMRLFLTDEARLNWLTNNTSWMQFEQVVELMKLATDDNMPEWMKLLSRKK